MQSWVLAGLLAVFFVLGFSYFFPPLSFVAIDVKIDRILSPLLNVCGITWKYTLKQVGTVFKQFSFSSKNTLLTPTQDLYNILKEVEFNYSKLQCMLKKHLTIFFPFLEDLKYVSNHSLIYTTGFVLFFCLPFLCLILAIINQLRFLTWHKIDNTLKLS